MLWRSVRPGVARSGCGVCAQRRRRTLQHGRAVRPARKRKYLVRAVVKEEVEEEKEKEEEREDEDEEDWDE